MGLRRRHARAQVAADAGGEGLWADVGRQDVRDYTLDVTLDIVNNYDVDGIVFDRIRYSGSQFGYNPTALSEMLIVGTPAPTNEAFREARRDAVTDFLVASYEAVTDLKPWVTVGTVPVAFGDALGDTYNGVFQDWPEWSSRTVRNRVVSFGAHDTIQPQYYRQWDTVSPFEAPAANQRLMLKAMYGDVGSYTRDYGLFPGALVEASPLFYFPVASDSSQADAVAVTVCNVQTGTTYKLNGWGTYPADETMSNLAAMRASSADTCTDLLANPAARFDYLWKAGYDNTPPSNVTDLAADDSVPAEVTLTWSTPAAAADGEVPTKYLVYRDTGMRR
ncbi:MAG: family 10 glycosylhydrolase [Candidatus Competibacteraceae bacterium]|nr:family 10 glycosylhydrolase [Candidatus Competibacteraceae bacterium]